MQRFFTGVLCLSVLLLLCSCASLTGDTGASGQKPVTQTETKAAAPAPVTTETKVTQPTSGTTGTPAVETTPGTRPPGPVAEVPEKSFDFGTMREDRDYSHTFIIKNVGTSELVIKKILPG